jgi:hypothetical protein
MRIAMLAMMLTVFVPYPTEKQWGFVAPISATDSAFALASAAALMPIVEAFLHQTINARIPQVRGIAATASTPTCPEPT